MSNTFEQPSTMRDVARAAGVSIATVSYVVNNGPRPVSAHSRRRVLDAMERLGYQVRRRRGDRMTIGVVVPDATNTFFARTLAGVQSALQPGQYVLAASTGEDPAREQELLRLMAERGVDGLIVTPCTGVTDEMRRLPVSGTPVVIMDRDAATTSLNSVAMNDYGSAVKATRLLADSGHRRIALLNGPERIDTARERRRGYLDAIRAAGLPVVSQYVRDIEFGRDRGAAATRELLALDPPPDAIFSTSLVLTAGMLGAVREQGLSWPADIAVVGFGDALWTQMLSPPLTVVEQPAEQLGMAAAQVLLSTLRDGGPGTGKHIVLESRIVLRDSHWRQAGAGTVRSQ